MVLENVECVTEKDLFDCLLGYFHNCSYPS